MKNGLNVYPNNGYWYIRYKDPITSKWKAVSTRLNDSKANYKLALKFRDQLVDEIEKTKPRVQKQGTLKFAFEKFLELNSNKAGTTINTYSLFFNYFTQKFSPELPCTSITKQTAESFLLWLAKQNNLMQNTKFSIQKNFVKFLGFLFEYEYIPTVFIINKNVKTRPQVKEPKVFSTEDREKILKGLETEGKNSNFSTMVYMLMYTGLRPSDIINITVEQIDLSKMEMRFYSSKTDNWFVRPIHEKLKDILTTRINEVKTGRIFNYADVKTMARAVRRYYAALKMTDKGYTVRTFRKDFISRSQESGVSIAATAMLVGHSNIKTTMTYYTKFSSNHLKDELSKLK